VTGGQATQTALSQFFVDQETGRIKEKKGIKEKKSTVTFTLTFDSALCNLSKQEEIKISVVVGRRDAPTSEFVTCFFVHWLVVLKTISCPRMR
jgi:hypothetical protein